NQMASGASGVIARQILENLFQASRQQDENAIESAHKIFAGLQKGTIDRSLFTDSANKFFTQTALNDYQSSLGGLGAPESFTAESKSLRGGMVFRSYAVRFRQRVFEVTTFEQPDGKLEQYLVIPKE